MEGSSWVYDSSQNKNVWGYRGSPLGTSPSEWGQIRLAACGHPCAHGCRAFDIPEKGGLALEGASHFPMGGDNPLPRT